MRHMQDMRLGSELNEDDSFIGQKLFVLWGGTRVEDGYYVDVVYETDKKLCVKHGEDGRIPGEMELIDRFQIGNIIFKNMEEAKADRDHRKAEMDKEKAEYQRKIAEKANG